MKRHARGKADGSTCRTRRLARCGLLAAALVLVAASSTEASEEPGGAAEFRPPAAEDVLRTLKPGHPRLMMDADTAARVRESIESDRTLALVHRKVLEAADKALEEKPPVHHLRDGRRLLYVSGEVQQRVSALAYAFRMTGREDYAMRAWQDLDAAAGFKDWNPAHFLDTAVMTSALAIGLDWLWDQWTPEQRGRLREAIVTLGLEPAMKVYRDKSGWHRVDYNWNQVCNGGIAMGALAVADEEPAIASAILSHAIASIPLAMREYAPDGAGEEGVSYWDFGSRYNVFLLASLQSALGTDFGLGGIDGFRQSGLYQIHMSGAGRTGFDFSDCRSHVLSTPQHFWMGRRYGTPVYSGFRHDMLARGAAGGVWDLLWFDPAASGATLDSLPLDRRFRHVECASMRDSWSDSEGFIVGMQGGCNQWTHRHYDLGSFILDADGVRWIIDSGKESETYQRHVNGHAREDFYRIRAEGHNTLVIDPDKGPGQDPDAMAAFRSFVSTPESATAVLDLTDAYDNRASHVIRTFELVRGKRFTGSDEIACHKPSRIRSYFHTEAAVELSADKRRATLTQEGKSLTVDLVLPAGAVFEVLPAEPGPDSPKPAKQASNEGRRKLAVGLDDAGSARIEVVFSLPPG